VLRGSWLLVPVVLLAGSACARGHGGTVAPGDSPPVHVEVTNRYALPVEIYAVGAGITHRLGTVHPGMAAHFVIPQTMIGGGPIELQASPGTSSRDFRSGQLLLSPGAVVDFVVAPVLFNSTATIRP
jgi:hypothetical protein